ncbi:MurR/RpiR family transcriptional regulator [Mesoplasma florum]|uniref:MurR/RpiR family transcriptional regulator n=1 Tax=Mesoplasma florum TaxID=2151 RepID=UPI000BE3C5DB|nr:MurR/RpiR family transcriptional regulator [Mesoplasma florum]ATI72963.1 hypothetical protein CQZ69_00045 [Mesoplasma florum]AVN61366.1 hypothetical protein CG004_00045 [Mesoplasma florum]
MKSAIEKLTAVANEYKDSSYKFIAETILKKLINKELNISQKELSELCFVSESTITKFSKFLGFSGFREFWFLLKSEVNALNSHEKDFFTKEKDFFSPIIKWVAKEENFIKELSNSISNCDEVIINSSYQMQTSAEFMFNSFNSIGKKTSLINHAFFNISNIEVKRNYVFVIILSGRDNETLLVYINSLKHLVADKNVKIYIITTEKQEQKIDIQTKEMIRIDLVKDWPSFVQRNIALTVMIGKIYENLLKTTFNKGK